MMQEQEHMNNVEMGRSTTTKSEITFGEMLNAIGDSLSDHASSDDEDDGDDADDDEADTGHGKLSADDEPGWVIGSMSKMVQHSMESLRQKQLRLDELTQPGWGDGADYFRERDMMYLTTEVNIRGDGKPQQDLTEATRS
jgi:hypothetical protein